MRWVVALYELMTKSISHSDDRLRSPFASSWPYDMREWTVRWHCRRAAPGKHGDAVVKLNEAFRGGRHVVVNNDTTASKGRAMRKGEAPLALGDRPAG